MSTRSLFLLAGAIVTMVVLACETEREERGAVSYAGQVEPLLARQCVRCHAGVAPAGGWAADSYLGAIGCTASGQAVTVDRAGGPPLLIDALERTNHAGFVRSSERAMLASWIASGTPLRGGGVHPAGFADPRSPESHARFLRARGWRPMLEPTDPDACGSCHEEAPVAGARGTAPNAPSCTSCHREPNGALACGTCHGEGSRAYPPRSRCFFPDERADRAHAAHADTSASRVSGLPCSTCHPTPTEGKPGGVHANGYADVWFDFAVAGREARFDAATATCTGTCHARPGGARPAPSWNDDTKMTCNDCHSSPPPNHYRGACTSCHREANADGTALTAPSLHVNGKVDLGDGSGKCGACHGQADDPWPTTGAHAAHASPKSARPVDCTTCHEVPQLGERHPDGRGAAAVRFSGLASHGGRRPSFDPATKTCAGTYCHEGSGATTPAPRWTNTTPTTCTSCHGAPPPPPHVQSATCGGATCHEARTDGLSITAAGRPGHVDGLIGRGPL